MSASLYDLLKYAHTGIAAPSMSAFDKARALAMTGSGGGGEAWPDDTAMGDGSSPIVFQSDGYALKSYVIGGNMVQSGTPTKLSPVYPQECGDYISTGTNAGKYAVPITLAGTTQTVYLDEPMRFCFESDIMHTEFAMMTLSTVGIMRFIKKIVLDGTEDFLRYATGTSARAYLEIAGANFTDNTITCMCSHYTARKNGGLTTVTSYPSGSIAWRTALNQLTIIDSDITSLEEFKQFLAQEYANGTPVTIWYSLAEPEEEEIELPTLTPAKGSNTLTVDTTTPCGYIILYGGIRQGA